MFLLFQLDSDWAKQLLVSFKRDLGDLDARPRIIDRYVDTQLFANTYRLSLCVHSS